MLLLSLAASLNPTLVRCYDRDAFASQPSEADGGLSARRVFTSITLGLVIVFSLSNSGAVDTAQNTLSPAADIALGATALSAAWILASGRHERRAERRRAQKEAKPDKRPPRWQHGLRKGSARTTFVVGHYSRSQAPHPSPALVTSTGCTTPRP